MKTFINPIEVKLINLANYLYKIINPKYIGSILNLSESMKQFCQKNSILWRISTAQFNPEKSKANIYNNLIKKEKCILDSIFNQNIQLNENIKADFKECLRIAQEKIDALILLDVKDENEKKIKEKLQENRNKLNSITPKNDEMLIVKNELTEYISQFTENLDSLTEKDVNDIEIKIDQFIELSKKKEAANKDNLIDWPDNYIKNVNNN